MAAKAVAPTVAPTVAQAVPPTDQELSAMDATEACLEAIRGVQKESMAGACACMHEGARVHVLSCDMANSLTERQQ